MKRPNARQRAAQRVQSHRVRRRRIMLRRDWRDKKAAQRRRKAYKALKSLRYHYAYSGGRQQGKSWAHLLSRTGRLFTHDPQPWLDELKAYRYQPRPEGVERPGIIINGDYREIEQRVIAHMAKNPLDRAIIDVLDDIPSLEPGEQHDR